MAEKWKKIKIGDVAEFRNGINYDKSQFGDGLKILSVADFKDYMVPRYESLGQIVDSGTWKEDDFLIEGDIVFVRSNGNKELIGRSVLIKNVPKEEKLTFSGFCIRLRFTPQSDCIVDPVYLFYFFRSPYFRASLSNMGNGTNISNLNQVILQSFQISLPPLPIQRRIAATLSAYDELIENNRQRIALLEELAEELYREWFVRLRFPGWREARWLDAEGQAVAAGTEGALPEGWGWEKAGNIYETSSGGTPSRKKSSFFTNGTINWLKTRELNDSWIFSSEEKITDAALSSSSAKLFPANSVLIAIYGATIGKLGILAKEMATNQACVAFLEKSQGASYLFVFLHLLATREALINLGQGAAQQNELVPDLWTANGAT